MRTWMLRVKRNFEVSLGVLLAYRENILYFLLFESLFLGAQFLTVSVGYDLVAGDIHGWTRQEAFILTAINGFTHQVFICFFISGIFGMTQTVWDGAFDYVLLKPIPPLAGALMYGQMVVSNFPGLIISFVLMLYLMISHGAAGWESWLALLLATVASIGVRVGLALLVVTPIFFSERLSNGESSFWSLVRLAGYPMNVYWKPMERFLTYVIPVAVIAWVPAGAFLGKGLPFPWLLAIAIGIVFSILAYAIFSWGVRHYKSVNSGV